MTRTIREWQKAAHELAVEKGFHSRECATCLHIVPERAGCSACNGTGRIPIDPHNPTRIAARLALIHCEISEAVECVARGRMSLGFVDRMGDWQPVIDWHQGLVTTCTKPEGFPIELADVFLRLCDLAESLGVEIPNIDASCRMSDCETPEQIAAECSELHLIVSRILCEPTDATLYGRLYTQLHFIAVWTHVDLLATAELKHEYNRTRPIRHGGKVL